MALAAPLAVASAQGQAVTPGANDPDSPAIERYQAQMADFAAARDRDRSARFVPALRAKSIKIKPGDMFSATARRSATLQMKPTSGNAKVKRVPLSEEFIPRAVAIDDLSGRVAIAAVSRVLLYDPDTGAVQVLTGPEAEPFAFANDVVFDQTGQLIIADQGEVIGMKTPADGRLWQYDGVTEAYQQIGQKRDLSDPKLLALDRRGRIHVVDGSSGPLVSPLLSARYDTVWQITGATRRGLKPIYRDSGLQATAVAIDPDGKVWFGSVDEIVLLQRKKLVRPCPLPSPLAFVSSMAVDAEGGLLVMDGAGVTTSQRVVYEVDAECALTQRAAGSRLKEARGLAIYKPASD